MRVRVHHRPRSAPWGRFGGGWQWKVGVQSGDLSRRHGNILVSLLVLEVRIGWGRR